MTADVVIRGSDAERRAASVQAAGICLRLNPDRESAAAHLATVLDALGLDRPAVLYVTEDHVQELFVGPQT